VFVWAPSDALDDEYPTFLDVPWDAVSNEQDVRESLRPVVGAIVTDSGSVLEIEEASPHTCVEAITHLEHFPLC